MPMLTPAPGSSEANSGKSLNGMPTLTPKPNNGHDTVNTDVIEHNNTPTSSPLWATNGNGKFTIVNNSAEAIAPVVNGIDTSSSGGGATGPVMEDITDDEMDISDSDDYDESEMNKSFDGNETQETTQPDPAPLDHVQPVPAPPPLRSRPSRFSSVQTPSPLRPPPLARAPGNQLTATPATLWPVAGHKTKQEPGADSSSGSLSFTIQNEKAILATKDIKIERKIENFVPAPVPDFKKILESEYHCNRDLVRAGKDSRKMECDCRPPVDPNSDIPCGEDCLNRVMSIECSNKCRCADKCTNRRFQKRQYKKLDIFSTEGKGHGLKAKENIQNGEFIIEYIGEVVTVKEFTKRSHEYSKNV